MTEPLERARPTAVDGDPHAIGASDVVGPPGDVDRTTEAASSRPATQEWFRGDIDGLRALAIVAVVAFHANITRFAGGFVGVDVFFVISGYLITTKLVAESESVGRVSVLTFWAKRLRRLVPAMAVMLVTTLVVSVIVLSPRELTRVAGSGAAAAVYISNIVFANGQNSYFGAPATEDPFLHTWSLGVEEQFYLLWPLLIWAVGAFAARAATSARGARFRLGIALTLVLALSFVVSLSLSEQDGRAAFYGLPSRAWEFAAAGLVAILTVPNWLRRRAAATVASAIGLALIVAAVLTFDGSDPYPGWLALVPTIGTLLVIIGGSEVIGGSMAPISRGLAHPSLRWIGRVSYSWYLWHWPFMVFASAIFISESPSVRVPAGLAALAVAWWVHVRIENPIRFSTTLRRSIGRTYGLAAILTVLALAVAALVAWRGVATRAWPDAAKLEEANQANDISCRTSATDAQGRWFCAGGDPEGERTVVLAGDSHAGQWMLALDAAATEAGVRLVSRWGPSCPAVPVQLANKHGPDTVCTRFQDETLAMIDEIDPDLVVFTQSTNYEGSIADADGRLQSPDAELDEWERQFRGFAGHLADRGVAVATIIDTPRLEVHPLACLGRLWGSPERCARDRTEGFADDQALRSLERRLASELAIPTVDASDRLCDETDCRVLDGDLIVYGDKHHVSTQWALANSDLFGDLLDRALPPVGG